MARIHPSAPGRAHMLRLHQTRPLSFLPSAVIEEELQRPVEEVYATISDQPVAAASLGQVRAACAPC